MIESRSGMLAILASSDSHRAARRLGWSVAASILAGTALVPASAQTFDLGALTVTITNFTDPPASNPAVITNGVLQVNNAANLTFGGDLTDAGGVLSIHKFGLGSLTLSGVNTYTGPGGMRVSNGTLIAGSLTAFSPNSFLLLGGVLGTTSTVDLNGFSQTTSFLQSAGAGGAVVTSTAGPATLTIAGTATRTFDGGLQGEVNIVKQGSSIQTFQNTKSAVTPTTNTGTITLQAGGLSVGSNNVLGSGTITVAGASTLSTAALAGTVTLNNAIILDADLAVTPNAIAPLVLGGNISGAAALNKSTGTVLALTGNNSYAGGTTVAGGRLLIGSNTALGLGTVTINGGTLALNDVAVGRSITNDFNAGAIALTAEAGDLGTVFEFSGSIAGSRTLVLGATGGDGTVLLSGANSYTGITRVQSGVLGIGSATAISNSSSIRLETSGTGIAIHTAGLTVDRQITNLLGAGPVSATINTRGFDAVFSGRLNDAVSGVDDLALTKTGGGILTVSNASTAPGSRNIVSGGVTVAAGTLNLTGALHNDVTVNAGTLAGTGSVTNGLTTIASGAVLSPGDATVGPNAIGRLTFTNLTLAGGSAVRFDLGVPSIDALATPNDIVVVNGDLNLGGTLTVNDLAGFGNGSYRLFTFGGAVTGTLSLNVLPGGLAGSINVGAGVVDLIVGVTDFYWDGAGLANNIVDGGTGTWSSAGTNWTDVNGVPAVAWGNQLGLSNAFFRGAGGVVTLSDSFLYESLNFETDGYTLAPLSAQTLDGTTATINVATGVTATVNVELAGTALTKTGDGTLTLGNANTYSGGTLLTAGRINVANDAALGPDGLTMSAGTTLGTVSVPVTLNNTIAVAGGVTIDTDASLGLINTISGSGGILKTGAGQLTLSGNNNFTGDFNFSAGQIVVGSSTAFGNVANIVNAAAGTDGLILANGVNVGNAIVLAGATPVSVAGTATLSGEISGPTGSINKVDSGTLVLTNNSNSYGGGTSVVGTLQLNSSGAASFGLITLNAATLASGGAVTLINDMVLNGNSVFRTIGANTLTINDSLSGTGDLTIATSAGAPFGGQVTLNQPNSFIGSVIIAANANLGVGGDEAFGDAANTVAINDGLLSLLAGFTTTRSFSLGGAAGRIDVAAGHLVTVNSAISGSRLQKGDDGLLILGAANSYTGGTDLLAGELQVAAGGALGDVGGLVRLFGTSVLSAAGDVTIGNAIAIQGGAAPTINSGTGTLTLTGALSGDPVVKAGAGTLVLNGDNTGLTGFTADAGIIVVGSNTALGGGIATFNAGTTLRAGVDGLNVGNAIVLGGAVTIDTQAFLFATSGEISGSGPLTKIGNGVLFLDDINTYTGGTNVNAGSVVVYNSASVGTGTVAMADGTQLVTVGGTFTTGNAVTVTGTVSLLAQGAGDLWTLSGVIADGSGPGLVAKNGPGTVTLTGSNTYTGGTRIDGGTLAIDDGAAIGSGAIALANGTTLRAGIVGAQSITLANALSVASGTGTVDNGLATSIFTDGTVFISGTTLAVNGAVTGAGTLRLSGGATRLADTSGFTGNLALAGGALLDLVDATSLGNGTLQADGGTGIRNDSGAALSFANTVTAGAGLFVVTGANDTTLTGVVTANGLAKAGPGTLTLGNSNNAIDELQIYGTTVAVTANGALGAGTVRTLGGGTLRAGADNLAFSNAFAIGGDLTVDTQAFTLTLSGTKTGTDGLIKAGTGTLILDGTNSYAGDTDVNVGTLDLQGSISGNVNVAAGASLVGTGNAAGTVTFANDAIVGPGNSPGTLNFGSLVLNNTTDLDFELAGLAAVPGTGADLIAVTNDLTLDGVLNITGLPGFNVGVGNRTLITYGNLLANNDLTVATVAPVDVTYSILAGPVAAGAGIVELNVAFTGTYRWDGTDLAPDGTIDGGNGTFNLTNTNFTNSNGSFNLAYGNNATDDIEFGGAVGSVDVASAINFDQMSFVTSGYTLGGVGSLNAANSAINLGGNDATINTSIIGGALAKNGSGTLTLAGTNSFASFAVNGGTVIAASDTALGAGTATFAGGTALVASGTPRTLGNAIVINAAGGLTVDAATNTLTLNGGVSGTGPLNLVSSGGAPGARDGVITLAGGNSYTGGTTITGTTAIINADSGLGDAAGSVTLDNAELRTTADITTGRSVVLNGTVPNSINTDAGTTLTANGVVSGGANLEKVGTGRLVLGNAGNSFSGGTNITAGTVAAGSDGALGTGNIVFSAAGGTLETLGSFTTAKTVTLDAAGTINTNANSNRFDGVIAGANALTKTGAGTLILTGTNGYAATFLNAGTLQIDDGDAIGAGVLTTTAGTTLVAGLAINTPTLTLANNIVLGAGGNTTINLLGSNYGVNVTTGALNTNGTALVLDGVISGDGGIDTLGFLANGGGSIAFNSTNSFTGGVNLGSVIAYANADNALGTGTVNLNAFGAGIQNLALGTTSTLVNAINVNDFQHSVGGAGNLVLTGAVGGNGQLFKVNDGTVTFTGAGSSYGGNFAINDGTVLVNGSFVNAAATYVVAGGARLGGTGSIAGSVTLANGADLNPGTSPGTLTVGNLSLGALTNVNFELGAANTLGGVLNDRVIVTGNLVLDGLLNVSESVGGSFGLGIYNLFSYGTLTDNGLTINGLLPNALTGTIQHNATAQQINLVVAGPNSIVLNWDGTDFTGQAPGAPLGQGGNGVWNTANTNWAGNAPGEVNATWQPNAVGIFGGTGGTVDVASPFAFAGLGFQADGYTLANAGGSLTTNAVTGSFISVDPALTATINATIAGTGVLMKQGAGTLVLGGTNTLTGNVNLNNGTLAVTSDAALGLGSLVFTGGTTLRADASVSLANAMTLNGLSNISSNGNTLTLGGVLSGTGALIKQGAGSVVLNGANGYSGGTSVEAGSVVVGNNLALGTGDAFFNDGTSLVAGINGRTIANNIFLINTVNVDTQAFDLTLSGVIGGGGPLTKLGAGNLILTGNNIYAGGSILLDGTVTLGTSTALGSGQVDVNGQVVLLSGAADLNIGNAVVLNDVGTFDVAAFTTTYSGVISGAQVFNKVGSGNLVLTNANLNSGGTTLNEGRLTVADDAALGTGALTMAGGTTLASGAAGLVLANAITTNGLGSIDTAGNIFTLNGVIDGAGSIAKIGSGNLVLNGANSYTGGSSIAAGTVTVGNNTAFGTNTVTMADGTVLANNTDNLVVGNDFSIGNVNVATGANNFTLAGVVNGAGLLTKTGSGNLILNGANGYTGGTALTAGTITVGTSTALGSGRLTASDATSLVAGISGLNVANLVTLNGNLNVSSSGIFELSGVIDGAGSLTKVNSGNLILSGANSYAGGTALTSGSITFTTNTAFGTGTVTTADGTLLVAGRNDPSTGVALTLANNLALGAGSTFLDLQGSTGPGFFSDGTVSFDGTDLTLNGVISGTGALEIIDRGRVTLNGANSYSGGTIVTNAIVNVGSDSALGTGVLTVQGSNGMILGNDSGALRTLANDIALSSFMVVTGPNDITLNGVISGNQNISKASTATLTLNGINTVSGFTSIFGGRITVGNNSALGTSIFNVFGFGQSTTLAAGTDGLTLANNVTLNTGSNLTVESGAGVFTLGGVISGPGALTKVQSGNLVLNGANTFTGGSFINAGTVTVGNNAALGTGLVIMLDGTTLTPNTDGLVLTNEFNIGNVTMATDAFTFTLGGPIGGSGLLTKTGSGNLVLSGSNAYGGGTALTAGSLTVTNNNSIGTGALTTTGGTTLIVGTATGANTAVALANAVVLGAGTTSVNLQGTALSFNNDGSIVTDGAALTLNGVVSGDGALATGNFGTLTLNGDNSYSGGTLINTRSVVYVGSDTAVGTGTVTTGGATGLYNISGATRTLANAFVLNGGTWLGGSNDLVLNGAISGAGFVIKAGAQTLTLNGANSFAGTSQLRDGRITVGTGTALGTGALRVFAPVAVPAAGLATTLAAGTTGLTLANAITLDTGSNLIVESGAGSFTLGGVISGAGALTKTQAGTLVLNGANTFTGGTSLNVGTVQVGNNAALGVGGLVMAGGTTLQAGAADLALANAITTNGLGTIDTQGFAFTLNGVVGGAGSITKIGSGNLVLNGANTFTGGSFINAGTVTVGNNAALGTGLVIMLDGTTLTPNTDGLVLTNEFNIGNVTVATDAFTFTLGGPIGGSGLLTKTGSGNLVLSGSNAYGGGTALTAGSLTVTNNNSIGTGALTTTGGTTLIVGTATGANTAVALANAVVLGAGTTSVNLQGTALSFNNDGSIVTDGAALTLNGVVSGAGALATGNFGTLTLNGDNSYSGGTLINTRSVVFVGSDTAVGTGTVTTGGATGLYNISGATRTLANAFVLNGGTWLGGSNDLVLNGVISGAGFVIKAGAQTLTLNGANSFAGTSQLRDGRITVGTGTALGTGALRVFAPVAVPAAGLATTLAAGTTGLTLANAITLDTGSNLIVESGAGSFTLGGVISGAGALTKTQAGTLVLNGANTFTGGTSLNVGTVQVGSNTALGVGGLVMAGGTTLQAGVADLALANAITTNGLGTIDTQGFAFTLNGVVGGAGSITKIGSGNLVLNGANTYTGGSFINAGTVTVGNNAALGTGLVTMANGTVLANNSNNLALANAFSIGNATIATGSNNFTLNGVVGGAGLLTKTGSGVLVLNGENSYTGGTALTAGTIRVGTSLALGTGGVAAAAGTTLQAGNAGVTLANTIAMAGGMTADNNGQQFGFGGVVSGVGPLSVIDSTGGAAGVLTLSGTNSYTGGTVVTGTAVRVAADVNLGNAAGNVTLNRGTLWTTASFASARTIALGTGGGTIQVAPGTAFTVNGTIAGTALTKTGTGELVLNTLNSYLGGTSLNAGTITVANDLALGLGTLAMAGGTTLNTATNLGTTPNSPTVTLANAVTTAGVGTVNTGTGLNLVLNGVVSGAGSIAKTGAGLLVLNGANSFGGGTALVGGTIRTGTGTALGTGVLTTTGGTTLQAGAAGLTVANAITLGTGITTVDTQAFTYTLSGVASGAGSVSKIGSGILNLTAASTYTGATTVAAGTLNVTGSLVSAVTVNSGAALTGTGTVGALNVLAGGSVAPGAPGTTDTATITVTGAATLAGTYTANITTSANDRISAGGVMTVGGTLAVVPTVPANFNQFNQTFTVASGSSLTGTFGTVSGLDQFGIAFAPVVSYTATQANIRLAPQSLEVLGNRFGGVTGNALEVARAFDRAVAGGYNPQAFFNVYANGGSALPLTLRQMSGEQRATERRVVLDTNRVFRESALDRLNSGTASLGGQQVSTSDGDRTLTFWLRGAGSWGKAQTNGAATAFTTEQRGVITGLDWAKNGVTVGGMFHYTSTDIEYRVLAGSSTVETVGGTVYGGYRRDGGVVVNGGISISGARTNGSRAITLPSFAQSLAGTTKGNTYQFFGEAAYDLAASADTRIEPFARLAYVKADIGRLTETGGVAALAAGKQGYDITVINLGARVGASVAGGKVALNAGASWQGTSGDRDAATVIGIPAVGQNGLIRSVQIDRSALSLQADAGVNLSQTVRFSLGYSGLIGKRNDDHGGRATLNVAF